MGRNLGNDLRIAFRMLVSRPGFTGIAILNLALGIGANTAMFSVLYGVLFKPLPYHDPDRLVLVYKADPRRISPIGTHWVSTGDLQDWRQHNAVFESMAGYADGRQLDFYTFEGDIPETVSGAVMTRNLFETLGVGLLLGRTFLPEEGILGGPRAIILGYDLWLRRYGGDGDIVGKSISVAFVGGEPLQYTVVGVGQPGFRFPPDGEYWTPFVDFGEEAEQFRYRNYRLQPIARLKPGVTLEQASDSMRILGGRLDEARSAEDAYPVEIVGFLDHAVGNVKQALLVFASALGFVLMIACANVATLVLSRALARRWDVAIRTALGASRLRIIRHLLMENLLLGLGGLGVGLVVAYGGMRAFLAHIPGGIPRADEIQLGWPVLLFAACLSLLTAFLFGLWPIWSVSRVEVSAALASRFRKAVTRQLQGATSRNLLAFGESALAMILMVGAALMLNSFLRLSFTDPGFNPQNLLVVDVVGRRVSIASTSGTVGERPGGGRMELLDRLLSMKGVESAAYASSAPPAGVPVHKSFRVDGSSMDRFQGEAEGEVLAVSHGYFETMQIPLTAGRGFVARDIGQPVVVVSQMLAHNYLPEDDPIGRRILIGDELRTIVGIARDVRHLGLDREAQPTIYWPTLAGYRTPDEALLTAGGRILVRTTGEPSALAEDVRLLVENERQSPSRPAVSIVTDNLWHSLAQPRFQTFLIAGFGLTGLILAVFGIYGTVSFGVTQRTREIGICLTFGATPGGILRRTIGQGMVPVVLGITAGCAGAWTLSRYLASLLHGLPAADPTTFVSTAIQLALVAHNASWVPGRRASRTDPVEALRHE